MRNLIMLWFLLAGLCGPQESWLTVGVPHAWR
jgi:hypothetical protein